MVMWKNGTSNQWKWVPLVKLSRIMMHNLQVVIVIWFSTSSLPLNNVYSNLCQLSEWPELIRKRCFNFIARKEFAEHTARVIAIRHAKAFVDQVSSGAECGILLDRTNFYAESGGQTYDEGFFTKVGDDVSGRTALVNIKRYLIIRGSFFL